MIRSTYEKIKNRARQLEHDLIFQCVVDTALDTYDTVMHTQGKSHTTVSLDFDQIDDYARYQALQTIDSTLHNVHSAKTFMTATVVSIDQDALVRLINDYSTRSRRI